jgi:poly(hydroxyalkanoate) depolymerase family esterase
LKNFAHKSDPSAPKFDASGISETIRRALASAGLDTQSGLVTGITETINRSLATAGLMRSNEPARNEGVTIEGTAREVQPSIELPAPETPPAANDPVIPALDRGTARPGVFTSGTFTCAAGTRAYKVYVPASHDVGNAPMPLVVMLHGCTQSPDDFAAGTRMNALADQHGFVVVYPAQCGRANASKCWNWFRSEDQGRDRGEPSIIAGIAREVAARHGLDTGRIFVAGMSAGAAMAVVLGATYPDLFAAVGAHSGLPYGAAHDMPSAFGAMQGRAPRAAASTPMVPTIVFHGDADRTVQASNGDAIVRQAARASGDGATLRRDVQQGVAADGTRYERTTYIDAAERIVTEQWVLDGAAHAWSGGNPAGSYTDARGPDASAEMVRFFLAQRRGDTN